MNNNIARPLPGKAGEKRGQVMIIRFWCSDYNDKVYSVDVEGKNKFDCEKKFASENRKSYLECYGKEVIDDTILGWED